MVLFHVVISFQSAIDTKAKPLYNREKLSEYVSEKMIPRRTTILIPITKNRVSFG